MGPISIPGYAIERELGVGGMARVYLAIQSSLERRVALKVMAAALAADASFSKRFLREARTIASLTHPHIVAVYEVGVTNDHLHYFSMQYLPGGDFAQRMRKGVAHAEIVRVLTGIAKALGFAHQQGVVHRDVTPGNIMFDGTDTPLLTDFGIARALSGSTRITSTGVSIGTSNYMSPEQARGGEVDARSDLYSLGALAFEALTGRPPYQGPDGFAVAYAHVFEPIPRLPAELRHWQPFIDKALAKDPKDRFASAEEFIAGLQQVPVEAPPASTLPAPIQPARSQAVAPKSTAAVIENLARQVGPAPAAAPRAGAGPPWARLALVAVLVSGIAAVVYGLMGRKGPAPEPPPVAATVPAGTVPVALPASPPDPPVVSDVDTPDPGTPDPAITADPTRADPLAADPGSVDPLALPVDAAAPADASAVQPAPPEQYTVATPAERIQGLVVLGQALLQMQRLQLPPEGNATLMFARVLELDSENAAAKAGLAGVVDAYLALSDQDLDAGRIAEGKDRLQRARQVAQTPGLDSAALLARIDARWNDRVARLHQQATDALAVWQGAQAEAAAGAALALVPGDAALKKILAEAKVIGKPGYRFRDAGGPELVIVGGGDVLLGGARRGGDVRVDVGKAFAVMRREVSVNEFKRFVEATRHTVTRENCRNREGSTIFAKARDWREPGFPQAGEHPVVCVGYNDALAYARWLSQSTGQSYRLPSEAEWQWLARQVKPRACASGNRADAAYRKAEGGNRVLDCDDGQAYTAPAGRFEASTSGLYDIEGNVREWVADCANEAHAGRAPDQAARTSGDCSKHMIMGSAWHSDSGEAAVVSRRSEGNDWLSNTVGFRLVRELAPPKPPQR